MRQPPVTIPLIEARIASYIAEALSIKVEQIPLDADVEQFGLNSAVVVSLIGDLEDWLGIELSPSILYEYPTVRSVSQYLHSQIKSP
jgi:acyl carrier protein